MQQPKIRIQKSGGTLVAIFNAPSRDSEGRTWSMAEKIYGSDMDELNRRLQIRFGRNGRGR